MTDIIEKLQKLVEEMEKWPKEHPKNLPALRIESIHDQYAHLLTPEAAAALEPQKKTTLYAFDADKGPTAYSRSIYLTTVVRSVEAIESAAKELYSDVNTLAAKGVLRGHLQKLSVLALTEGCRHYRDLHEYDYPKGTAHAFAVFVFPHVKMDWKSEGLNYEAEEGAIGRDLEPVTNAPEPVHSPECKYCKMLEDVARTP